MKLSIVTLFFLTTCTFLGCKYEDGPSLSLLSKKSRAANTWVLDEVFENGTNMTDNYKNAFVNYKVVLNKDNSYVITYRPLNISDYKEEGIWSFDDSKNHIEFKPNGSKNTNPWKILRLKSHQAWVIQVINNKDVELRMKD